jgi:hypothetical protein
MHLSPLANARTKQLWAIFIALASWLPSSLFAQTSPQRSGRGAPVTHVSFVGCRSDGQVGPLAAPTEADEVIQIDAKAALRLAYYKAEHGSGVLAPRGWYCFGTYGSGGSFLYVAPQPIKRDDLFSRNWRGFTGPAIEVDNFFGGTSGRFGVARIIARVFPAQRAFVQRIIREGLAQASDFVFGPYPDDRLRFPSNRIVEYQTPPHCEGLGTISRLQQNDVSIEGVAILQGQTPDLLFLTVRLPPDISDFTSYVIHQSEQNNAASLSEK